MDVKTQLGELKPNNGLQYNIYVRERAVLNNQHKLAYDEFNMKPASKLPKDQEEARKLTGFMCKNFFDVRAFGAVMTTEVNCGQVRGPVQFTFAKSLDPIIPMEISVTRMAVTNERDLEKERTMGRKHIVPYGLYRAEGFVSPHLAMGEKGTGFAESDLELFWEALEKMFEIDHSAARGKMAARKLVIFKHDSALGNAPAQKLFDLVQAGRKPGEDGPPRSFDDYLIEVNTGEAPAGVEVMERF